MRFRKKPVEIEAHAFVRDADPHWLAEWCGGEYVDNPNGFQRTILIETLEGTMIATEGDWIIRGVQGEFYPCKPDIFLETYEQVD